MIKLSDVIKHIKVQVYGMKISRKILIIYVAFLVCCISLTMFLYSMVSTRYAIMNLKSSSNQTLLSINTNINEMVDNVGNNYDLLLKINIQKMINEPLSIEERRNFDSFLFTLVDSYSHLEAIYIMDMTSKLYGYDKSGLKTLKINNIEDALWFEDIMEAQGGIRIYKNGGDIFESGFSENFISIIRIINDLETQMPIGVAMFNIPLKSFEKLFEEVFATNKSSAIIYNEYGEILCSTDYFVENSNTTKVIDIIDSNHVSYQIADKDKLYSGLYNSRYKWKLIAEFLLHTRTELRNVLLTITVLVLLINAILMSICSVLISKSITIPINQLIAVMQNVKTGKLRQVEIDYRDSEIGILKNNYNRMIDEIQLLINQLINEQKVKRKTELLVLHEQIKPHFLYNTLNAIAYMSLTEQPNDVYDAIETLGEFYRGSLSKGSEIITVKHEIKIVDNYLTLLKLRYGSMFEVNYDIDEEALSCHIIKLLLQPIVENAVYHGIKPKGEKGIINIIVKVELDSIRLIIEDNGLGMDRNIIKGLYEKKEEMNNESFGLRGTMERINIYYGELSSFHIESTLGIGTKVIISIPKTY